MTRYLVTGAAGMLGQRPQHALAGREVTALARADLDVTDADAVRAAVAGHDVVVNSAAYTEVDGAEAHEDDALRGQRDRAENLARRRRRPAPGSCTSRPTTSSTATATEPVRRGRPDAIRSTPTAAPRRPARSARSPPIPDGAYVVRTAWLYGARRPQLRRDHAAPRGDATTRSSVVDDQLGQPTWTADLAAQLVALVDADCARAGIYHGTNAGQTSWFGFARAIFEEAGLDPERVRPTDSASFVAAGAAPRVQRARARRPGRGRASRRCGRGARR